MSRPIEVSIDELTLHGFDPRSGGAFVDALRAELSDVLAGWQPSASVAREALELGAVHVASGTPAGQAGRAVGGRIGRAMRAETDAPASEQATR